MARFSVVTINALDQGYILTPERYTTNSRQPKEAGIRLRELCEIKSETLSPQKAEKSTPYLILDTGDVKDGFIRLKPVVNANEIGSTKKVAKVGDVIISRLRPYLRQVGYVDKELIESLPKNTVILCSTEFFILRSSSDISYLAPFLLTSSAQEILNQSQEGGHHPRFNQTILENIDCNKTSLEAKKTISLEFKNAILNIRTGESSILSLLRELDA
jgi:restriction endonuclease S subunit